MRHTRTNNTRAGRAARLALTLTLACAAVWAALPESLRRMVVPGAEAAGFVVTTAADNGDDANPTPGSLRKSILDANANGSGATDTISFNIPGGGVKTISPPKPLPAIKTPTVLDGYTQPGAQPNTNAAGAINAVPLVELNGAGTSAAAGADNSGLVIDGPGVTVRGLVVNRFQRHALNVVSGAGVIITGNFLGTDAAGAADLGNTGYGISLESGDTVTIGGSSAADRNLISGNGGDGVASSSAVTKLVVAGNLIGTDKGGAAALGNGNNGLLLNTSGAAVKNNVISGNAVNGVITAKFSEGNTFTYNIIGLNAAGTAALPNAEDGVRLRGNKNSVDFNTISGNGKSGIRVARESFNDQPPTGNFIRANRIGTDLGASADLGNKEDGVTVEDAFQTTVGGNNILTYNLISGNDGAGVHVTGISVETLIYGNLIGTNGAGDAALGNTLDGVYIQGGIDTAVGSPLPAEANLIAGNKRHGVYVTADQNAVSGNYIGTKADGASPIPNAAAGVLIEDADDIGVTGNSIAFNGSHGVSVKGVAVRNKFYENSIHSNGGLGINLGADGVTPNDGADADSGPNGLQNFPVITSAQAGGGQTQVAGTLHSAAGFGYNMHFYANSACDPSGHGEGQQFLGQTYVEADNNDTAFAATLPAVAPGTFVTATAQSGGTSEFSLCFQVAGAAAAPEVSISDAAVTEGNSAATDAVFNVTLSAASAQEVNVLFSTADGAAQGGSDYEPLSGTLTFNPGETSKTISIPVKGDTDVEPDENFSVNLTPVGEAAKLGDGLALGLIKNDDAPQGDTVQFDQAVYTADEQSGVVTLTVERAGDLSAPASVDYATKDGNATERTEYTTALGTLRFAPGETKQTVDILLTEDSADELEQESFVVELSNPQGVALGADWAATVKVSDDASEPTGNAIDDAELFVRQHYHDFLGREPDAAGLAFWTNELLACGSDQGCLDVKRQHVSAAFFLSIEFQQTGFLVHRVTEASYDRLPRYRDFVRDARQLSLGVVVGQGDWQQQLEANKQAFMEAWVARAEFKAKYDALSNEQYVDALYANAGVAAAASERQGHVDALNGGTDTRAGVLRKVSEGAAAVQQETNRAFVLMQYFGYLRRDPDAAPDSDMSGFNFWLAKLNQFGGDFQKAEMVRAFLLSTEYRSRFGQP